MKKIITLLLFFVIVNVSSQEKEGDRDGIIFYSTIERTDTFYNINIDLYELGKVRHIEVELYDDNEVKLASKLVKLTFNDKKYYLSENDDEVVSETQIEDINLKLENPDNTLSYPKLKIKMLNNSYDLIDYSQKIFY